MNDPPQSSDCFQYIRRSRHPQRGSLILVVLVLVVCAGAMFTAFLLVERSEHAHSVRRQARISAKTHAINALHCAIAQLQESAGPDKTCVIPATLPHGMDCAGNRWTGVIPNDTPGISPFWLVSGTNPDPTSTPGPAGWVSLPDRDDSVSHIPMVAMNRQDGTETVTYGHMAWITSDESLKADASVPDILSPFSETALPRPFRTTLALTTKRRSGTEAAIPALHAKSESLESTDSIKELQQVLVPEQLMLWHPVASLTDPIPVSALGALSVHTLSIPTNPIAGGLKTNLSDPNYTDHDRITPRVRWWMTPGNYGASTVDPSSFQIRHSIDTNPPGLSRLPSNASPDVSEPMVALAPVLTEFKLYVGIFVGRSDGIHRIRYHMESELLNPYPWDLAFDSRTTSGGMEGRGYIVMVRGLPIIEISNTRTLPGGTTMEAGRFQANLSHFEPESQGFRYNSPSDALIHSWQRFSVLTHPQTGWRRGIDAGTVYQLMEPDKADGLARTLSNRDNYWDWTDSNGSATPLTIAADDTISVRSLTPADAVTLEVVPYAGEIEAEETPDAYKARHGVMLRLKNIPFGPIRLELSGSQYCLHRSADYTIDNYRFAYYFRLKDDPESLDRLSKLIHPQDPEIDFSNPEIRELYSITSDPVLAQQERDVFSSLDPLFWDMPGESNDHPPDRPAITLSELPVVEPISPSVFSSLILHGKPYPSIGCPEAGDWNDVFDRYVFSGHALPDSCWDTDPTSWTADQTSPGQLSNPGAVPIPGADGIYPTLEAITGSNGAARFFIRGGFNINSTDPLAWAVFLHQSLAPNAQIDLEQPPSPQSIPSVFSRLPFALPSMKDQRCDSGLFDSTSGNANPMSIWSQGLRILDRQPDSHNPYGDLHALATAITHGVRSHGPFHSIRDFASSPVLREAIASVPPMNKGISGLAPAHLSPADILRGTASNMVTRGDTFRIRAYGDTVHPGSGVLMASALCEAWVQRFPEYFDPTNPPDTAPSGLNPANAKFGRRFRVVAFRWLNPPHP
ncbi:MAG: hypothetical protein PHF70_01920 [Opitutales bacterium]|nr:hypothetical protein [Opitutales bacterium]